MASIQFDVTEYLSELSDDELMDELRARKLSLDGTSDDDKQLWERAYFDCRSANLPDSIRELFWEKIGRLL